MARVIAVTGGKGGTGKSTVATAMAGELARQNKVLLVDADVECPNDHIILGARQRKFSTVEQMIPSIDNKKCLRCGDCVKACSSNALVQVQNNTPMLFDKQCNGCNACFIVCQKKGKAIKPSMKKIGRVMLGKSRDIDIMSGFMDIGHEEPTPIVKQLKKEADGKKESFDYIIVDTAPGTHCNVVAALDSVDYAVAVTEPTSLGAHDLGFILALLSELGIAAGVVLNKSGIGNSKEIEEIIKKHSSELIAEIPYSDSIARAYSEGRMIGIPSLNAIMKKLGGKHG